MLLLYSCQDKAPDSSSQTTENTTVSFQREENTRIDTLLFNETSAIKPYSKQFNEKDVFFALIQRTNTKDTVPAIITDNYTKEEIKIINQKIIPLKKLTNLQLLSLYKEVSPGKVIYGNDDREPVYYDVSKVHMPTGNSYVDDGKSVVAIIDKFNMNSDGAGNFVLQPKGIYKNLYSLCETERFCNEPVIAHCSGFSVSPDKIVTAGHCISKTTMKGFYFVFDYIADATGIFATKIPGDKVYEAVEFIDGSPGGTTDFAVIKLNKVIPSYRIAKVNPNVNYSAGDLYHVIGYPCGLPMKIALRAALRRSSDPNFFVINSDTYGGNSGSPVFNSTHHMVEGILVRGEEDFNLSVGSCRVSFKCPFNGCRGEDVSKNTQFIRHIN